VDVRVKLVAYKIRSLDIAEGPRALDRARRRPEREGSGGVLVDRAGPMKIGTRARAGYNLRAVVELASALPEPGTRVSRTLLPPLSSACNLTVRNQRLSRDQTGRTTSHRQDAGLSSWHPPTVPIAFPIRCGTPAVGPNSG